MKRNFKGIMLLGITATVLVACEKDESHNEFSVNIGKTVEFAKGNLQYQASTGTWRFAEHQYDFIGSDNSNISSSYDGWIDLFGWATSGWDSGAKAYQPYDTSTNYADYRPGNNRTCNLAGDYAKADWGVKCKIINDGGHEGQWRTLLNYEWNYLLNQRTDAQLKRGMAEVADFFGFVILPDYWKQPSGTSFKSGETINKYTIEQWQKMESAGAVFLPAAGYRYGTNMVDTDFGYYWSASYCQDESSGLHSHNLYFRTNNWMDVGKANRNCGLSVRLTRDLE